MLNTVSHGFQRDGVSVNKIGIFFGTDSGSTRLIAKMIAKRLGPDLADKPLNVNRVGAADFLEYDALILGTPTYGEGQVPGSATGVKDGSWAEFLPQIEGRDLSQKLIALYGLGDQDRYPGRFANGLAQLHAALAAGGARFVGEWSIEGYAFETSKAVVEGRFVGLVLDQPSQRLMTEPRIEAWLETIRPALLARLEAQAVEAVD